MILSPVIQPIPATGGATAANSQVQVSGLGGTITSVEVTANIADPADGQLRAVLESPSGTQIPLFTDVGGTRRQLHGNDLRRQSGRPEHRQHV